MILSTPVRRLLEFPRSAFAALLVALAVGFLFTSAVAAQEGSREEVRYIGDHDILVVPVNVNLGAGAAHYAVIVTHPETGEPVSDARVVLVTSHSEESNPGWAIATNNPAQPDQYDVHLKLDSTGEWTISVDVSSSLGADFVDVDTIDVPSVNRLTQGSWVFLGVFVAILGGIAYVWITARRDYRRKRAAPGEAP